MGQTRSLCMLSHSSAVEGFGLVVEKDSAYNSTEGKDAEKNHEVHRVEVWVNIILIKNLSPLAFGSGRVIDIQLVDENDIDPPLQAAEILQPAQDNGDLLNPDEEASKQDLRDQDSRSQLHCCLDVSDGATHQQSHGGCGKAQGSEAYDVHAKVAMPAHQEVVDCHYNNGLANDQEHLHHSLAQHVGSSPVHPGKLLSQEHRPLEGEGQESWLHC
mmetsp:Transcript_21903/g.51185  ORF Transcript_21903/g.51185 Transcript_21903/m.51185 type:complete len:215 (+) Transcript_21903:57-701(+)